MSETVCIISFYERESCLTVLAKRTLRDLSEALVAIYGTDYGIHSPTWISSFTDMTRQGFCCEVRVKAFRGH
jgi:uncharacterized protein YheU (UPF0270 family)